MMRESERGEWKINYIATCYIIDPGVRGFMKNAKIQFEKGCIILASMDRN